MNTKYLTQLNDNPTFQKAGSDYIRTLQPISMDEILSLESIYNNGQQFPVVLRELLFLAGNYCYVLDYGLNDTQQLMQEQSREYLTDLDRTLSIDRPFYVIDVYNAGDQFLFVYLDEGVDDPMVHEAIFELNPLDSIGWIHSLNTTLSQYIIFQTTTLFSGYNPF
jgi:hypothetical protein